MPVEIGTKQGITYYCDCKRMSSIISPTLDNKTNMRYTGFFKEMWNEYEIDFDVFGYGLKKTRENKALILCDDASKCFNTTKGYVGIVLSLPYDINNGVYQKLLTGSFYLDEYLLWGVNVGTLEPSYPSIYVKLTKQGIEFTIWTEYGKHTLIDNSSNIHANDSAFYEFIWDSTPMDDFMMSDFDASMSIRVNGEDVVLANYPIAAMDLSLLNFCALDTPLNSYNIECIIRKLILGNEIPTYIQDDWYSSSSSIDSSSSSSSSSTSSSSLSSYLFPLCSLHLNSSGGDEGFYNIFDVSEDTIEDGFYTVIDNFTTYNKKDRLLIYADGVTVYDSGCIATNDTGIISGEEVWIPIGTSEVGIRVFPNCEGTSGTAWVLKLHCKGT